MSRIKTGLIIITFMSIVGLYGLGIFSLTYSETKEALLTKATTIADLAHLSSVTDIEEYKTENLQRLVETISSQPHIVYAVFVDKRGIPLTAIDMSNIPPKNQLVLEKRVVYDMSGKAIGAFEIALNKYSIWSKLAIHAFYVMGGVLLITLMVVGTFLLQRASHASSYKKIRSAFKRALQDTDLGVRIQVNNKSPLTPLANSFNMFCENMTRTLTNTKIGSRNLLVNAEKLNMQASEASEKLSSSVTHIDDLRKKLAATATTLTSLNLSPEKFAGNVQVASLQDTAQKLTDLELGNQENSMLMAVLTERLGSTIHNLSFEANKMGEDGATFQKLSGDLLKIASDLDTTSLQQSEITSNVQQIALSMQQAEASYKQAIQDMRVELDSFKDKLNEHTGMGDIEDVINALQSEISSMESQLKASALVSASLVDDARDLQNTAKNYLLP